MTVTSDILERRYRKLLRAYPRRYRAERGDEIVGTYLQMASPERTRPTLADRFDVLRGALRPRLRAERDSMAAGARLAAVLALSATVAMSVLWLLRTEDIPIYEVSSIRPLGPFQTVGPIAWFAWLVTAIVAAFLPGRWVRRCAATSLVLTPAVYPLAWVLGLGDPAWEQFASPPPHVLVPHVILGAVALAFPLKATPLLRFVPLLAGIVTAGIVVTAFPGPDSPHYSALYFFSEETLLAVGIAVFGVALLIATVDAALHRRTRGMWASAVLTLPAMALVGSALRYEIPYLQLRNQPWVQDRVELTLAAVVTPILGFACACAVLYLRKRLDRYPPRR